MRTILLAAACFGFSFVQGADVEVTVDGVDAAKGTLLVGFFDNAADFQSPGKEVEGSPEIKVTKAGRIVCVMKGLKPGVYAVAVIWDQNNNGILDTGAFKRPKEPYGFSLNPKVQFGPPKYEECTFTVTEPGGKLHVNLIR
ncbi:MAG: DUF2141 domain-containing protein [Verrucomicrobiales bacterium]|nr:DUF2141 domain-containing protein [Verrucomicrobiales bacterium]